MSETNRNIAMYRELIIGTSVDGYMFAVHAKTGDIEWEAEILDYTVTPVNQTSGPIHRQRQGVTRAWSCYPSGGVGRLCHHRTRRDHRRGAVALPRDSGNGRVRRRNVDRCPVRGTQPRRVVGSVKLRPGARPGLHRHVGDIAGTHAEWR